MNTTNLNHSKYSNLLFDLDNTLLDYTSAEDIALSLTFKDLPFRKFIKRIKTSYHDINSGYWRDFEQKKIKLADLKVARFRDLFCAIPVLNRLDALQYSESYLDHLAEQVNLISGAAEVIRELSDKYKMGLVTNGIARVQRSRILKSGFNQYFPIIIISEEIGFSKPEPAFFSYTLNELGNPAPGSVMIIGDNLHSDIMGGGNAGMDTCWFNPGKVENESHILPNYTISNLCELINILTL
jgi:2-haloacid dehalogenase